MRSLRAGWLVLGSLVLCACAEDASGGSGSPGGTTAAGTSSGATGGTAGQGGTAPANGGSASGLGASGGTSGTGGAGASSSPGGSAGSAGSASAVGGSAGSPAITTGSWSWIRQFGDVGDDDDAYAVGVDAGGNVLVLAAGTDEATPPILQKFDASGTSAWSSAISEGDPRALAVHADGDSIVTGEVELTDADGFESGDVSVWRYDPDGQLRWQVEFGSADLDGALDVNVNAEGHTFVLWSSGEEVNGGHAVLTELDADGNVLGDVGIGVEETVLAYHVDRDGNLLSVVSPGDDALYSLRKYDAAGNLQFDTPVDGTPAGLASDADGNVLVVGISATSPSALSKFTSDGTLVFNNDFGDSDDYTWLVAADAVGRAFAVGTRQSGPLSSWDVSVRRFDADGTDLGLSTLGSDAYDSPSAVAVDPSGALLVAGRTEGTLPGQTSFGSTDAFVARLAP